MKKIFSNKSNSETDIDNLELSDFAPGQLDRFSSEPVTAIIQVV